MRIRAVLRDSEILQMPPGSKERIIATAKKNIDRIVNLNSLLKVMGLKFENRLQVLEVLEKLGLRIWLANEADQHVIFLSDSGAPESEEFSGYQWC